MRIVRARRKQDRLLSNVVRVILVGCALEKGIPTTLGFKPSGKAAELAGQVETFENFMAPLLEAIENEKGMRWQHAEFRDGPGWLCDLVKSAKYLPAVMTVEPGPLWDAVKEVLKPRFEVVIRG